MAVKALLLVAALLLANCASLPTAPDDDEGAPSLKEQIEALRAFKLHDVQAALARARRHGDRRGEMCWARLEVTIQALPEVDDPPVGLADAYEAARVVRLRVEAGISEETQIACAPMVSDSRRALLRLARKIGVGLPFP